MTFVNCYNSSKDLKSCNYDEFPNSTTTSMDININCGSDTSAGESDELRITVLHINYGSGYCTKFQCKRADSEDILLY